MEAIKKQLDFQELVNQTFKPIVADWKNAMDQELEFNGGFLNEIL